MELVELMKSISYNAIPHFLILYGEEQTILDMYIQKIVQATGAKKFNFESVSLAVKHSGKKSLDKSTKLYTIIDDNAFIKAEDNWGQVKDSMNKNYLIIRYNSLDKRSAFFKRNKENIVEFSHLTHDVLSQYISRDLPDLCEDNANKLVEYCNYDYGRILMEIDKIKQWQEHYTDNEGTPKTDSVFKLLDKQGLFYKEIGDITFELTDAVLGGYPETAMQKLDEAKWKGEPAMMIASILYNGFRNLLAYQGLGSNKKGAVERTGLSKGDIWRCSKNVGGYSIEEVKRNMLICQNIESGIKTGIVDEDIALEYLVLSCLK
jgi:DNA polymerase III delta subunit